MNTEFTSLLETAGWKVSADTRPAVKTFYKVFDGVPCAANQHLGGIQVVLSLFTLEYGQNVEIDICGMTQRGRQWVRLSCYAIPVPIPLEDVNQRIDALLKAWNDLAQTL